MRRLLPTDKFIWRKHIRSLVDSLTKATNTAAKEVILVSIGIEGLSSDEASLIEFQEFWEEAKGLKIKVSLAETVHQWGSKAEAWKNPAAN